MSAPHPMPTQDALESALNERMPNATPLGAWHSSDRYGSRIDLVYAFDAFTLAGLRHWRQEDEWMQPAAGGAVVAVIAWEASTLARLGLKAHPRYDALQARQPAWDAYGLLAGLPDCSEFDAAAERFCALEAWLQRVRRAVTDMA